MEGWDSDLSQTLGMITPLVALESPSVVELSILRTSPRSVDPGFQSGPLRVCGDLCRESPPRLKGRLG